MKPAKNPSDKQPRERSPRLADVGSDPGARICGHDNRKHYLGGGLWVCFSCWAKLLIGGRRR